MARTARTTSPVTLTDVSVTTLTAYADAEHAHVLTGATADLARVPAMLAVQDTLNAGGQAKMVAADITARFGAHPGFTFLPSAPNRVVPFALTGVLLAAWSGEAADLGHYVDQYRRTVNVDAARVQAVVEFLCNRGRTKEARAILATEESALAKWVALVALFDARKAELDAPKGKTSTKTDDNTDGTNTNTTEPEGDVVSVADAMLTLAATLEAFMAGGGAIDETTPDTREAWNILSAQLDNMVDTYAVLSADTE